MAKHTVWHDIFTMPADELVIVWNAFDGCKLRSQTEDGTWYDDNEIYDDSGAEWDLWTELPMLPGPTAERV